MNRSRQVQVELGERSYAILIEAGILEHAAEAFAGPAAGRRGLLITDSNVGPLYAERARAALTAAGATVSVAAIPAGEEHKRLETCAGLYAQMVRAGLNRSSFAAALGGGVTGDITGFTAATYMRGIPFIQIPTSLLAMVDSSVGGKTGVDLPEGKNLVGAFWQPALVVIDPQMLITLPLREIRCGLAEIVKTAVILDEELFYRLERNVDRLLQPDLECYTDVIARCCELKAGVVSQDETEQGMRAILNYGHTFGHAVEKVSNFQIGHGEAVAIGMVIAADLTVAMGEWPAVDAQRQEALLRALGLPTRVPPGLNPETLMAAMGSDKKKQRDGLVFILPRRIGEANIRRQLDPLLVQAAIRGRCD